MITPKAIKLLGGKSAWDNPKISNVPASWDIAAQSEHRRDDTNDMSPYGLIRQAFSMYSAGDVGRFFGKGSNYFIQRVVSTNDGSTDRSLIQLFIDRNKRIAHWLSTTDFLPVAAKVLRKGGDVYDLLHEINRMGTEYMGSYDEEFEREITGPRSNARIVSRVYASMKDAAIKKIFGAAPPVLLADWYIGPSRAEGLIKYAVETLIALGQPIYQNFFKGTANENWYFEQTNALENTLRSTIATWVDEEVGPRNEENVPLSKTGKGAKARYQQYIVSWIERALDQIKNSAPSVLDSNVGSFGKVSAPPPSGPTPDWANQWQWYEDAVNDAVRKAQAALPQRTDIDWSQAWDWAETRVNPTALWQHYQFDQIGPPKIVENSVWLGLLQQYAFSDEERAAIKNLLPVPGGRAATGPPASLSPGG